VAAHTFRKGLDLPLAGAPAQVVDGAPPVRRVGLLAADTVGLRPVLQVKPGDRVQRGTPLYEDGRNPGLRFTAPAAGTVAAVHRGERRALQSVVIDVADDDGPDAGASFEAFRGRAPASLGRDEITALLVESGLWTALRTRPFSRVPAPGTAPQALFVTAMDSRPHAPAASVLLEGREEALVAGVSALARLTDGTTYVCKHPGVALPALVGERISIEEFAGPHPAGTAGLHIHRLHPVDLERTAWHVGLQDACAIGTLLLTGRLDVERVVSLAGPSVRKPRLVRTRIGASIEDLVRGELEAGDVRVVSGSVLDGRAALGEVHGYLGRYHQQVSALPESRERELFGYIAPGRGKFSIWGVVLGHWLQNGGLPLDTNLNGGRRAMVPIGAYERVMPFDLMPTYLLRALIVGDIEQSEALGCLELDEDDLALCTFVCPGKYEYGPLLRDMLERIHKELVP